MSSESTEPLAGRLGVEGMTHSEGISYKPPCGEVEMCPQVGRMGPISEDGPGHYNLDWRAAEAARTEVLKRAAFPPPTQNGEKTRQARSTKDGRKPHAAKNSQTTGRHCLTYRP